MIDLCECVLHLTFNLRYFKITTKIGFGQTQCKFNWSFDFKIFPLRRSLVYLLLKVENTHWNVLFWVKIVKHIVRNHLLHSLNLKV